MWNIVAWHVGGHTWECYFFFFNDTATTEIYTYDTLFPYTTLFRSEFGGNHADLTAIGPSTGTGQATAVLANRVSYQLGLTGPSLVVDTACSSSLIAVHLACASLRSGECEFALDGGVSLMLRPEASVAFSRARMLASGGRVDGKRV